MPSGLHVKYPLLLSDFNDSFIFWIVFRKNQISNFTKIHPVGAVLFYVDTGTDRQNEADSPFSKFCENP